MKLTDRADAIVAIATPAGRGAVGIVRASGASMQALIEAVCGRPLAPRQATYLAMRDAAGEPIDRGLAIHFPAPHSYTGEDVLELQVHGGPVVLQLLLARCLAALPGSRLARPGEFTERAFLNDKLDLAQAEAVSDLVEASTEAAARAAGRSLAGALSADVEHLAAGLLGLRSRVEASLDFPEEEIEAHEAGIVREQRLALQAQLETVLKRARQGTLLREGLRIVLAGQPNVGKSSLLNALAGAELAIVTAIPGTTRDRIGETIQIEGVPVHVVDTAGLRGMEERLDEVERIGIARSWEAIESADVLLFVHDLGRVDDADYAAGDSRIEQELAARGDALKPQVLHVDNKADLAGRSWSQRSDGVRVSARTGEGLNELRQALLHEAGWQAPAAGEGVYAARARHVHALERVQHHLQAAGDRVEAELVAEELRLAHEALGSITGIVTPDELLGEIFSRFCIGK